MKETAQITASMNNEQFRLYLQVIRQQIAALQQEKAGNWEEINAAIENLFVLYEQMQTKLDAANLVEEELLQQNQQLAETSQYFFDLFQFSPIASLVTDVNGVILEANQAIALLLNVPQRYLTGKPLALYVAERDRFAFRTKLAQIVHRSGVQVWQFTLRPRDAAPITVGLQIKAVRNAVGDVETLRMGMYAIEPSQAVKDRLTLPQSLEGVRVLVVDDEPDVRDFITAILEPHGVGVRAVESAEAALQALEEFRPDVLVSDVRLPGIDGYRLIQQIRALEAQQSRHLPAAAITAYPDEDRETAIAAGFEAHLHKLAQPIEIIQVVARLAGRSADGR